MNNDEENMYLTQQIEIGAMLLIVYLILWSPVLDPPTIESHSAQCSVASTS
jgi:hypothetical protein